MKASRITVALKYVYLTLGIFLIIALVTVFVKSFMPAKHHSYLEPEYEVLHTAEKRSLARDSGLVEQGIYYEGFHSIGYSGNLALPVAVRTYEEAAEFEAVVSSANNAAFWLGNYVNIVFLDSNQRTLRTLLKENAFIQEFDVPSGNRYDSLRQHIVYRITTQDSDGDSVLSKDDEADLYISGLHGAGFTQITHDLDVAYWRFNSAFSKLNITYYLRDEPYHEYRRKHFAVVDLATGTLRKLSDLDTALEAIERQLHS